jgi:signal transduction histidine kinase
MQASRARFARNTLVSLAVGGAFMFLISASCLYFVYKTQEFVAAAVQARQTRSAAVDLLLLIQTAESGQRGYLLSQNEMFLKPYEASVAQISSKFDVFAAALADTNYIHIDIEDLRTKIHRKIDEMNQTLQMTKSGDVANAIAIVRNEYGLGLMTEIREIVRNTIRESDEEIANQLQVQLQSATYLKMLTIIGSIAIVVLLVAVTRVIRKYVRDITAARLELEDLNDGLEVRVRERTEDLVKANHEIQRFAYIVTHDLRSPLVNIMGFTKELESTGDIIRTYMNTAPEALSDMNREDARLAVDEDMPEAIRFIRSSTEKMDGLINAILKISRDGRRKLKPELTDLKEIVRNTLEAQMHQLNDAGAKTEILIDIDRFVSDRASLEQVFSNLIDNAIKYREPTRPLEISIKAYLENRFRIIVEVTDNGRGIAAEDLERVFELFRRSGNQDVRGEGIGLAHVRSILGNLGSDISVTSELGAGTTFRIRLPANISNFLKNSGR